ncbi:hypothetical protein ROT00_08135 [Agromyces mediolanus]|uniref:hypothetical protein n=1 Tax=Agromyces mediolanus TaxID=41986 RepID=UPI0038371E81
MNTVSSSGPENFPTSRAGLLVGAGMVAFILFGSAAQAAGVWFLGSSLTVILIVTMSATLPRVLKPRGTGLRAPVSQRQSGWIYLGVVVFGCIFVTTTLMTGQPLWSLVAGIVLAAGTLAALLVIVLRRSATEAGSVDD